MPAVQRCKVRIIQLELDLDELDSSAAAVIPLTIVDGLKDGGVGSTCRVRNDSPFSIVP